MRTPQMTDNNKLFECCENNSSCGRLGRVGMLCARWFPIFFVFTLVVLSIYFFFVELCINYLLYGDIPRKTQGALYICAYWILLVLASYCYIRAAFGDPGSPEDFNIKITLSQEEDSVAFTPDQYEPVEKGGKLIYLPRSTARMCGICNAAKPPRTHHCSTCRRCFLKMDHHCVWLDNCVGHGNYKFFYCLLFWATFICGFIFGATLEALIQQLVYDELNGISVVWLILTFLAFALMVSTLMLLCYHSYLISKGMTTIEHMEISEERDDFKRRERIRRRQAEREEQERRTAPAQSNNNTDNNVAQDCNDARSTTNLLSDTPPAATSKYIPYTYSEGLYRNWCLALGSNPLLWLIPINLPVGNGIRFKMEEATVARNNRLINASV